MLTVRKELLQLLKDATGLEVYFLMPPVNVNVAMPLIVLEETSNNDYYYSYDTDNDIVEREITSVSYSISIYASKPHDLYQYMPIVDTLMKKHGFSKMSTSGDMFVKPVYCKTMSYNANIEELDNGDIRIYKR